MTISIVIPTCGRRTLHRALQSVQNAGVDIGDEVLVVGDGPQTLSEAVCRDWEHLIPVTYIEGPQTRCWGHAQRNLGMAKATRKTLMFLDDDDEYVPNAITFARKTAEKNPGKIVIGQMQHRSRGTIWKEPKIEIGNVSTQMFIVPNIKGQLGFWVPMQGGDFAFIDDTVNRWPGPWGRRVAWWPFVLAVHHPCPDDPGRG
jgi:glycosyltransferase involved in cell wall biosynthesis